MGIVGRQQVMTTYRQEYVLALHDHLYATALGEPHSFDIPPIEPVTAMP